MKRTVSPWLVLVLASFSIFSPNGVAQSNRNDNLLEKFFEDRRPEIEKIADKPELLKKHVLSLKKVDGRLANGRTLLHVAANRGYPEIVKLLLQKGARVDALDNDKRTPLHEAMIYHRDETVRALLDHGANPNLKDKEGKTPFFSIVFMDGRDRTLKLTDLFIEKGFDIKRSADAHLLDQAIVRGHREIALLLLKKGCPFADSSLRAATQMGYEDIFNLLFEKGANPKQPNILLIACEAGNLNIVKTLAEKGNEPTRQDIDLATARGHVAVAAYLNDLLKKKTGQQTDLKERCRLKPEPGDCKALFWYAYYDEKAKACREASGCGGMMPFDSLDACKKMCE